MAVSVEVATLFLREMTARGVRVRACEDGRYEYEGPGGPNTISLDNISKEFDRDRDPERIRSFVESILTSPVIPSWDAATKGLYFSLEPADHDFGDTVREPVGDSVCRILVYRNEAGNQLMWVSDSLLNHWGQTRQAAEAVAADNMAVLLRDTPLTLTPMDGGTFGTFSVNSPFKAALLFAPNFREIVAPQLGWPLYALIPSRDFVYVFPEKDQGLIGVLARAALEEFENGAYPVSRDLFRISDEGIEAVFELRVFPAPGGDEPPTEEAGLKTIAFQGGAVAFRIPEAWDEEPEPDDDGGANYFDPDDDLGTLRLRLRTFQFEGPVDSDRVAAMLQDRASEVGVEVERLANGNALVHYTHDFEEDDEACRMWVWVITNPVLPRYARLALFTYTVTVEQAEDDEIVDLRALFDRELRSARFAAEMGG
jgi:hypothetical protein